MRGGANPRHQVVALGHSLPATIRTNLVQIMIADCDKHPMRSRWKYDLDFVEWNDAPAVVCLPRDEGAVAGKALHREASFRFQKANYDIGDLADAKDDDICHASIGPRYLRFPNMDFSSCLMVSRTPNNTWIWHLMEMIVPKAAGEVSMHAASSLPSELALSTYRLILRPLETADVDLLWPDIADPEISRLMAWDAHRTREQTVTFVDSEIARRESGRGVTWAILSGGLFCGLISLIGILRTHRVLTYNQAELAYWASRSHQRQGIMTEAARRVLDFAFRDVGLHKVRVGHFAENKASCALIRRLGFRYVGTQLEEFNKAGVWYTHVTYELLAREYAALQWADKEYR